MNTVAKIITVISIIAVLLNVLKFFKKYWYTEVLI